MRWGSVASCPTGISPDELDLWATQNCWWDFVLWQYKAYRMFSSEWQDWGFFDACNLNLAYPKAFNASYLVTYGLSDNGFQWHGTIDYRAAAEATGSNTHDQIEYVPRRCNDALGKTNGDQTELCCTVFDPQQANGTVAIRAATYTHEGWHHWQAKYGYQQDHMTGPIDACKEAGPHCDWYYWHGVGAYAFGEMWKYTPDGRFFHSPTQVEAEFHCDVAELSQPFVPRSVREIARWAANYLFDMRFRNAVGYRCGNPRPW